MKISRRMVRRGKTTKGKTMTGKESEEAKQVTQKTHLCVRFQTHIKSPVLQKLFSEVVANVSARVTEAVASELDAFISAIEQTFDRKAKGGEE